MFLAIERSGIAQVAQGPHVAEIHLGRLDEPLPHGPETRPEEDDLAGRLQDHPGARQVTSFPTSFPACVGPRDRLSCFTMSNNHIRWQITLVLALSAVSAFLYYIQYRYAGGAEIVLQWLLGSLAFLPVQVLILTLVVDRLLARREKLAMLKKLNMVIGVFFSETATHLLKMFAALDRDIDAIRGDLVPGPGWTARDFARKAERMRRREGRIDVLPADLSALKAFLSSSREFLLGLMANPNLLEHESFTDLLWAVFHLTDELMHREDVSLLAEADLAHLSGDARRAYSLLLAEWLAYLGHLREDYPYLYSLALRTNPFDPSASAEVR